MFPYSKKYLGFYPHLDLKEIKETILLQNKENKPIVVMGIWNYKENNEEWVAIEFVPVVDNMLDNLSLTGFYGKIVLTKEDFYSDEYGHIGRAIIAISQICPAFKTLMEKY